MIKIIDFFFASRPLLHLPVWTVFLVSLHYHHKLSQDKFDWHDLILMIALSLVFAGVFYINLIFDRKSDEINNKGFFLQKNILTSRGLMIGYILSFLFALIISYYLFTPFTISIILQIFILGFIYSASPLRLKDRPIGGLLANMYAHGFLVAIVVMPEMNLHNTGLLGWDNPFYFTLTVGSIYLLTTIPDRAGDLATGKRTLSVLLGRNLTLAISLLLMFSSIFIAYESGYAPLVYMSAFTVFVILSALLLQNKATVLFASKIPLLLLTLLVCYLYPYYFIFLVALLLLTRIYYKKRFGIVYPRVN